MIMTFFPDYVYTDINVITINDGVLLLDLSYEIELCKFYLNTKDKAVILKQIELIILEVLNSSITIIDEKLDFIYNTLETKIYNVLDLDNNLDYIIPHGWLNTNYMFLLVDY